MTKIYAAFLKTSGQVQQVAAFSAADTLPDGYVAISNWATFLMAPPFDGAELRVADGALAWIDPRTEQEKAEQAREKRDALLLACDWVATRAFETGTAVPAEWAAYRAALRDIPDQPGFPSAITWPDQPTENP